MIRATSVILHILVNKCYFTANLHEKYSLLINLLTWKILSLAFYNNQPTNKMLIHRDISWCNSIHILQAANIRYSRCYFSPHIAKRFLSSENCPEWNWKTTQKLCVLQLHVKSPAEQRLLELHFTELWNEIRTTMPRFNARVKLQ